MKEFFEALEAKAFQSGSDPDVKYVSLDDLKKALMPILQLLLDFPKDVPERIKENGNVTTSINEFILAVRKWRKEIDSRIKCPTDWISMKQKDLLDLFARCDNSKDDCWLTQLKKGTK